MKRMILLLFTITLWTSNVLAELYFSPTGYLEKLGPKIARYPNRLSSILTEPRRFSTADPSVLGFGVKLLFLRNFCERFPNIANLVLASLTPGELIELAAPLELDSLLAQEIDGTLLNYILGNQRDVEELLVQNQQLGRIEEVSTGVLHGIRIPMRIAIARTTYLPRTQLLLHYLVRPNTSVPFAPSALARGDHSLLPTKARADYRFTDAGYSVIPGPPSQARELSRGDYEHLYRELPVLARFRIYSLLVSQRALVPQLPTTEPREIGKFLDQTKSAAQIRTAITILALLFRQTMTPHILLRQNTIAIPPMSPLLKPMAGPRLVAIIRTLGEWAEREGMLDEHADFLPLDFGSVPSGFNVQALAAQYRQYRVRDDLFFLGSIGHAIEVSSEGRQ